MNHPGQNTTDDLNSREQERYEDYRRAWGVKQANAHFGLYEFTPGWKDQRSVAAEADYLMQYISNRYDTTMRNGFFLEKTHVGPPKTSEDLANEAAALKVKEEAAAKYKAEADAAAAKHKADVAEREAARKAENEARAARAKQQKDALDALAAARKDNSAEKRTETFALTLGRTSTLESIADVLKTMHDKSIRFDCDELNVGYDTKTEAAYNIGDVNTQRDKVEDDILWTAARDIEAALLKAFNALSKATAEAMLPKA